MVEDVRNFTRRTRTHVINHDPQPRVFDGDFLDERKAAEDAKEKKSTMDTYWVPGVNNLESMGRWAFAEFTDVYRIESDFEKRVAGEFDRMIAGVATQKG